MTLRIVAKPFVRSLSSTPSKRYIKTRCPTKGRAETDTMPSDVAGRPARMIAAFIRRTIADALAPSTPPSWLTRAIARSMHSASGSRSTSAWACLNDAAVLNCSQAVHICDDATAPTTARLVSQIRCAPAVAQDCCWSRLVITARC